ncbi:hypothetical protein ASC78_01790 [Variovorax sp. Root318D1]|uniref:carboxymuconolactone decarboxylase family protein n=1 Tax=Variovorax sp. Root318D1 TaxID=1736513 RepID=UPI0006FEC25F|nr:carboxymuconolactone decarboxylase family protein [Variovorax sp. Root318D1]KQU91682.1 hypothetical protein ASC78_01790 [Variovorax sp. Root318D1]
MKTREAGLGALDAIYRGLGARDIFARTGVSDADKALMRISALLGVGHTGSLLREALVDALANALTGVQSEDLIIHLASYVGIARAHDAMRMLASTLEALGHAHDVGTSADTHAGKPLAERFTSGMAQYARLDGPRAHQQLAFYDELSPDHYRYAMGMFGCTFDRPSLDVRAREIATVSVLAAMGTAPGQLGFHARVALGQGVEKTLLPEILLYVQLFAGLPAANNAATVLRDLVVAPLRPGSV